MVMAALACASTAVSALGAALFIFTPLVGVRMYSVRARDARVQIQRRVAQTGYPSCTSQGGPGARAEGYAVGRGYVMFADEESMWIVATAAAYGRLTAEPPPPPMADSYACPRQCKIFDREGTYTYFSLRCRTLSLSARPRAAQLAVIERVEAVLAAQGHAVAFLHGPTGVGKSMVGPLLAERLGGGFCNSVKPWLPGDTLSALCAEAEPSARAPLVVNFDEADSVLEAVHSGRVAAHAKVPTLVKCKESWNRLFDAIGMGMYPHVVVLLTSNRGPDFVRGLDPSYIRAGRVDLVVALGGAKNESAPVPI